MRLEVRKQELEEVLHEMEQRLEEEEEKMNVMTADKKKLQTAIQDLEEQYDLISLRLYCIRLRRLYLVMSPSTPYGV